MGGNSFGKIFRISTFGESHGVALGVIVDGCPAGLPLSEEDIQRYLERSSMTKPLLALFFFVFLAHSYEILLWMSFKASVFLLELGF